MSSEQEPNTQSARPERANRPDSVVSRLPGAATESFQGDGSDSGITSCGDQPLAWAVALEKGAFLIREASDSDVPALRILLNQSYRELADMGLNYTATYQDEKITRERISRGQAFALTLGESLVGTVLLTIEAERPVLSEDAKEVERALTRIAYISQLAIRPDLKRHGLGSMLMDHCEQLARTSGCNRIRLDTAKPAEHLVRWYRQRGYEIVAEARWEDKTYESWIFEKRL